MTQNKAEDTRGFALIVQQEGSAQQTLSRFLNLMQVSSLQLPLSFFIEASLRRHL
jgi:hypothetical protein